MFEKYAENAGGVTYNTIYRRGSRNPIHARRRNVISKKIRSRLDFQRRAGDLLKRIDEMDLENKRMGTQVDEVEREMLEHRAINDRARAFLRDNDPKNIKLMKPRSGLRKIFSYIGHGFKK